MMARLCVNLHIAEPRPEDAGSVVRVAVTDTSQADQLHPKVAEATTTFPAGSDCVEVVVEIAADALKDRRRYSLWGHVDHSGTGDIRPGDLIVTENIPISRENLRPGADPVNITLTRI